MKFYKGYVKSNGKVPSEPYKDGGRQNVPEGDYCGVLSNDVILVDVDNMQDAEIILKIIKGEEINARVLKTDRGMHFLFRSPTQKQSNRSHRFCAIGIEVDIKDGRSNCLQALKVNGKERQTIIDCLEPDVVPKWLLHLNGDYKKLSGLKEGEGRNDALFSNIEKLQFNGWKKDEIKDLYHDLINTYVLDTKMAKKELYIILRDEAFREKSEVKKRQKEFEQDKEKFRHEEIARQIISEMFVKKYENCLYFFNGFCYQFNNLEIEREILLRYPESTTAKRKEVMNWINVFLENEKSADCKFICFKNGVLDIETLEMSSPNPEMFITNYIPHNFNASAFDGNIEKFLNKISCYDKDIRTLIEEITGYMFYRRNELRKFFILEGDGSNGKSTLLNIYREMLGRNNYSSESIASLEGGRFNKINVVGKLANLGDDIEEGVFQRDLASLKKIVSGDEIVVEQKGQPVFNAKPFCKCIFSSNGIPKFSMNNYAMKSRMVIIPLHQTFTSDDEDYDPFIIDKLTSEEAIEYMIFLGILRLNEVLENKKFTIPSVVTLLTDSAIVQNDNVLRWFYEELDGEISELMKDNDYNLYTQYKLYCDDNYCRPTTKKEFRKRLSDYLNNNKDGNFKWRKSQRPIKVGARNKTVYYLK